jgi:ribosomal protein S18 acetylase RimI-like enzyme
VQSIEYGSATPDRVREIIDLANMVFMPDHAPNSGMGDMFPLFLSEDNASNLYVAIIDERVISHMGTYLSTVRIGRRTLRLGSMGAVCTHPEFRGRGLATNLFHLTERSLKEKGCDLLLTGGRGLYRRNGGDDLLSFKSARLREGGLHRSHNIYNSTLDMSTRVEILDFPIPSSRLSSILQVYEHEHIGFQRTLESFSVTLNSLALDKRCETVFGQVSGADNLPIGYAVVKIYGKDDGKAGELMEYAGERRAVLSVLERIIKDYALCGIDLCIPDSDNDLLRLLQDIGVNVTDGTLPGFTAKILSSSDVVRELMHYNEDPPGHIMPFPLPGANFV